MTAIASFFLNIYDDRFCQTNPFIFSKKEYYYNQIVSIGYSPNVKYKDGRIDSSPKMQINMKDYSVWKSYNFDVHEDSTAFQYISKKSGIRIDTLEFFE